MYPGFAAFGSFVLRGTYLYFGLATLGTYLYLWLAALGMYLYLGLVALGMYLYLGLVALGIFSYQERYIFISRAGISSYTYKSMFGMGLAALGSEKYIGRPGHKQVLRSGNPRYTGRADYDLGPIPITKSLLLRFTSPHSQKINYRDSGFAFA